MEQAVAKLCSSLADQCKCYERLWEITRRATGALAMSRGDFSTLLTVMSEKEQLLNTIVQQKQSVAGEIQLWQEQKHSAPEGLVDQLNKSLDMMENVIKRFLTAEKQLEKQISFYRKDPS